VPGDRGPRRRVTDDRGSRRRGAGRPDAAVVTGRRSVLEAVRAGLASQVLVARGARATPGLRDVLEAAEAAGVPVAEVERAELDATGPDHHGAAARVRLPETFGERELAERAFGHDDLVVVLDGIEDPQNLGASARSAEAAGAAVLVTRVRRAADVTPAAIRASAGALLHLPHARVANIARALERLRAAGFTVVGLDEHAPTSVYDAPPLDGRIAVVVGSEGAGLARLTRESCDVLVSLPMRGRVGSLNASASLAALLYAAVVPTRVRPLDGA
jgi:23S rRNA (guanosine2251-2'-O)-methyltransferase